jgi:diguanylate cyclase (GGDEF)-like protein
MFGEEGEDMSAGRKSEDLMEQGQPQAVSGRVFSIVIVDDARPSTLLLKAALGESPNLSVTLFTDPLEAIAWVETHRPDLVITDYVMPDMDGIALARRIRVLPHGSAVPIIMATARNEAAVRTLALSAGINEFLGKPVDGTELRARVQNMLHLREQHVQLQEANNRLQALNKMLALEIEQRKILEDELRRLATLDMLTGALTRRRFLELFDQELARRARTASPLCVLMIDLDHFKSINDRFGHGTGDLALSHFSAVCKSCLRSTDHLGRMGGEEFAALLPETNIEDAHVVAERMRRSIAAAKITLDDDQHLTVTVSIGVAECYGYQQPEAILAAADRALYQAKNSGRNRVVRAAPPGTF